jgi:hypothetical protein
VITEKICRVQHELEREAFDFIRDEFMYGGALTKRLVSLRPKGKVVAFLPVDTAPADLIDFGSGGVATGDEAHELADILQARVSLGINRICVFEHTARVGDPRMPQSITSR